MMIDGVQFAMMSGTSERLPSCVVCWAIMRAQIVVLRTGRNSPTSRLTSKRHTMGNLDQLAVCTSFVSFSLQPCPCT